MNTAPSTVKKTSIHVYCVNLLNKFTTNETVERKKHYIIQSPLLLFKWLAHYHPLQSLQWRQTVIIYYSHSESTTLRQMKKVMFGFTNKARMILRKWLETFATQPYTIQVKQLPSLITTWLLFQWKFLRHVSPIICCVNYLMLNSLKAERRLCRHQRLWM